MQLRLSELAIEKIKGIMHEQEMPLDKTYLRVGIKGHSCSGPVYSFALDEEYDTDLDEVVTQNDLIIVYEKEFVAEFQSVTIDYQDSEKGKGFVFNNPLKTVGGCSSGGCGSGGCHA